MEPIQIVLASIFIVILLYVVLSISILLYLLNKLNNKMDDLFYYLFGDLDAKVDSTFRNSIKSYFGIRLLCKFSDAKIDLDKFCEEYSNKFNEENQNKSLKEDE